MKLFNVSRLLQYWTRYRMLSEFCPHLIYICQKSVERKDQTNAFSTHLREHHQDREGDVTVFQFRVDRTFRKPLLRQIWEAVEIHGCRATIVLNSRAEWEQPVIDRVVVTRELPEHQPGGGRGGRRAGGGA